MKCPTCGVMTKVKDSTEYKGNRYRMRICPKCRELIYTEEKAADSTIVKHALAMKSQRYRYEKIRKELET